MVMDTMVIWDIIMVIRVINGMSMDIYGYRYYTSMVMVECLFYEISMRYLWLLWLVWIFKV